MEATRAGAGRRRGWRTKATSNAPDLNDTEKRVPPSLFSAQRAAGSPPLMLLPVVIVSLTRELTLDMASRRLIHTIGTTHTQM